MHLSPILIHYLPFKSSIIHTCASIFLMRSTIMYIYIYMYVYIYIYIYIYAYMHSYTHTFHQLSCLPYVGYFESLMAKANDIIRYGPDAELRMPSTKNPSWCLILKKKKGDNFIFIFIFSSYQSRIASPSSLHQ